MNYPFLGHIMTDSRPPVNEWFEARSKVRGITLLLNSPSLDGQPAITILRHRVGGFVGKEGNKYNNLNPFRGWVAF